MDIFKLCCVNINASLLLYNHNTYKFPLKRDNTTINNIGWAQFRSMTCSHSRSAAIPTLIMVWHEHGEVNKATVFFPDGGKVIKESQGIARQAQIPESHSRKTKPWCV